ncbi:MAG: cytochrome P450 [Terrimesophilobacter sp.]
MWLIRSHTIAQQVLQARHQTTQAGFTAEAIPKGVFRHHPILISDGPLHDEQRKEVGRFFSPRTVTGQYSVLMRSTAARLIAQARIRGFCDIDRVALHYSVEVTRGVVGLEHSSVRGMSSRLVRFFRQPQFDITRAGLGRNRRQWATAAVNGLLPILHFWTADVRPSVRALRKAPGDNVISHLIQHDYSNLDILIECVTYGTAGMVTTREFIAMALWHLLDEDQLRGKYLAADQNERLEILEEILRLEPVVGHLYRRVREAVTVTESAQSWTLRPGDLVDIYVRETNTDSTVVGANPLSVCPKRTRAPGVDRAGLSFSDGAHKCPGKFLAVAETEVFITALLQEHPTLVTAPKLTWDHLIAGYQLRGMRVNFPGSEHRNPR